MLFPKRPSKAEKKEIADLLRQLGTAMGKEQKAVLARTFERRYLQTLVDEKKKGKKGLRVDVQIRDTFTGKEWWCDTVMYLLQDTPLLQDTHTDNPLTTSPCTLRHREGTRKTEGPGQRCECICYKRHTVGEPCAAAIRDTQLGYII